MGPNPFRYGDFGTILVTGVEKILNKLTKMGEKTKCYRVIQNDSILQKHDFQISGFSAGEPAPSTWETTSHMVSALVLRRG